MTLLCKFFKKKNNLKSNPTWILNKLYDAYNNYQR